LALIRHFFVKELLSPERAKYDSDGHSPLKAESERLNETQKACDSNIK